MRTIVFLFVLYAVAGRTQTNHITYWLTKSDRSVLFTRQTSPLIFTSSPAKSPAITVDDTKKYQTIDGFGFALTGGSAQHIIGMSAPARAALLKELFGTDSNDIGVSYIRLSIGASDLNEKVFSYDDLPAGETDPEMKKFDLGPDRQDVIPVMKEVLKIFPSLKILASPWSPPVWIKTNNDTRGGQLKPVYYDAYAKYFVKYVQQMKDEGIKIHAITVQNEPLHPGNNPSLLMTAPDQAIFIKDHLGPAFRKNNIKTKIIVYDHNADRPDYPVLIYKDPHASRYVDGSGFHLYNGRIEALTDVHNLYPDKNIYFTEQMVVEDPEEATINISSPISRLIIGATRNWSRNVLEWNLAADPENKPYTDRGGCSMCQGAVTIDNNKVTRNIAYYSVAHASKFVRPGSVRIASNETDSLSNVAFKTPEGKYVLIVSNNSKTEQRFNIKFRGKTAAAKLDGKDVATYVW
jgi:glucosylceramidase